MKSILGRLLCYQRACMFNVEKESVEHGKYFYFLKTERDEKNKMCSDYKIPTFTKRIWEEHQAVWSTGQHTWHAFGMYPFWILTCPLRILICFVFCLSYSENALDLYYIVSEPTIPRNKPAHDSGYGIEQKALTERSRIGNFTVECVIQCLFTEFSVTRL
jgi:hypothetical protein